jgi:hypothetical protein
MDVQQPARCSYPDGGAAIGAAVLPRSVGAQRSAGEPCSSMSIGMLGDEHFRFRDSSNALIGERGQESQFEGM